MRPDNSKAILATFDLVQSYDRAGDSQVVLNFPTAKAAAAFVEALDAAPNTNQRLQVGQVIIAGRGWSHAYADSQGRISVNYNGISNANRVDAKRPGKRYVVEDTRHAGGGTGHGPHDVYPDGWEITARRLKDDGSYDPDGEVVRFYQSGSFNCMDWPKVDPSLFFSKTMTVAFEPA